MLLASMSRPYLRTTIAAAAGSNPEIAYNDLTLISPRATGAAGVGASTGLHSSDRVFFAYTGLEYNIPVVATGGVWPYSVSLSNAPSGMVAEEYTSESGQTLWRIVWSNPTSTASNIGITVTDALGTQVSSTWSITVGTSGWNFVDASNSAGGRNGSLANPWNSLTELRNNAAANSRTYFKNGTYTPTLTRNGGNYFHSMEFNSGSHSVIWLAYPGHAPVFDQGYAGVDAVDFVCVEFNQNGGTCPPWMDGLTFANFCEKGVMIGNYAQYGWGCYRCTFHDSGPAVESMNSGAINQRDNFGVGPAYGSFIVHSKFYNMGRANQPTTHFSGNIGLKGYSLSHLVVEGNHVYDTGLQAEAFFAMKGECQKFTIRANKARTNFNQPLYGGNMAVSNSNTYYTSGEECYNNAKGGGDLLSNGVNDTISNPGGSDAESRDIYDYRNTWEGRIHLSSLTASNGPVILRHNVIINADSAETPWAYIYDNGSVNQSVVTVENNLTATSATGILDASGVLQGTYATNYGPNSASPRGHEVP